MKKWLLGTLAAAALVSSAPILAQDDTTLPDFIQHTACEVDLTGSEIPIQHFGDISGSYAFITQPLLAGLTDAAAYYNARGGVCGATLVQENRDTGGDLGQTQAAYDYFSGLENEPDLLVLYASGDAELLRDQLAEDEIPALLSAGSVSGLYGEDGQSPGWIYASNPLYADQFGSFCRYIGANAEQFPEPVVGYISWPGAFGESAFTAEVMSYCAEQGVTILETPEYFPPSATDITTNVQNLVDAGANILYTNSLASGPFLVAKTMVDLGLEDSVQLAGVNWALDTSVGLLSRTALGSDGLPAVNGIIGSLPFHWWSETSLPGIALISEQAAANERPLSAKNIAYLLGWALVDTYIELYARAVNEVGSLDAVDGAVMKDVIEAMDYSPLGLYHFNYDGGALRALPDNRIAVMMFANADMSGVATSGEDAMAVPLADGTTAYVPVLVPLSEFEPAPDLRPGGADVPAS
ncbi:MAG: ABC transporter substrate-binding protein [Anaerolineae bacterium]|nr:ABC transporter substrate-binding protein [Anaerolineae bacterium]